MKLRRCSVLFAMTLAGTLSTLAQQPAPAAVFETISIKPSVETPGCGSLLQPGSTHFAMTCFTLRNYIAMAFKVHPDYVDGPARELDRSYDISAVTPGETPWTWDSLRPMIRAALEQRFHLTAHPGTREMSGFALIVAKGGPKLKDADPRSIPKGQKAGEASANFITRGHIQGRGVNAEGIAGLLKSSAGAPVIDKTGLKGLYDLDLSFAPDESTDSSQPHFFTAVEEELGLKLEPQKVTVNTVVVDHVDAAPTPD